jgi:hypothetical protein
MTRYNATDKGLIPFTAEQEAEWDAMVAEYVPIVEPVAPTKDQLFAEVQALLAKIETLA